MDTQDDGFLGRGREEQKQVQLQKQMQVQEQVQLQEQAAGPSTAPLAIRLRETPLRMTSLIFILRLQENRDPMRPIQIEAATGSAATAATISRIDWMTRSGSSR